MAASLGYAGIVELLLSNGADTSCIDKRPYAAIHYATWHNDTRILRCLLESGADANMKAFRDFTPLHVAVIQGKLHHIDILLDHGASPNVSADNGDTVLHFLATNGSTDKFSRFETLNAFQKILSSPDVDVSIKNNSGMTFLESFTQYFSDKTGDAELDAIRELVVMATEQKHLCSTIKPSKSDDFGLLF